MGSVRLDEINPRYMWLDPASGKRGNRLHSVRARSAIVVIGIDSWGRIYVLDAWADRVGTTGIVTNFLDRVMKWGPMIAAYEDMGQQSLLEEPLMEEAEARGVTLPLAPVSVSTKVEKTWRIRTILQPIVGAGRLILDDRLIELRNEITSFPMSQLKDIVDALASCCALVPPPRAQATAYDEQRDLFRYLRESGAPLSEIERYMGLDSGVGKKEVNWQRDLLFRRDQALSIDRR